MLAITEYSVEQVLDPFGILAGKRYEFLIDIDVPEDDELHSENGVRVRVIYKEDGEQSGVVRYELLERTTGRLLDYDMEPEEEKELAAFCREHLAEADE
ncbi:DUF6509 family protein [Cohnella thailandensis]|uniref:Pullulanase n=1 Tax=Cohnella thailandensis TaxID=557557 RepID=A0A841SXJ6_9BACL|nr:DUF6509 family protein [Cohnella thailandensis]MBB6634337.1 pullulanase [Cohnella thailandensis]MBP1972164.1 hypothetical protein [Cohnella thailandensis]